MNAAVLLLTATLGQCPSYSQPIYVYTEPVYQTCPAPTYRSNAVHEKVYFSGEVRSRCIVEAVLTNGKRITVPVINGYMPAIRVTTLSDGSTLREYDYYDKEVYNGGVIEYGNATAKKPARRPTVTDSHEGQSKRAPTVTEERTPDPAPPVRKQMPRYTDEDFESMRSNIRQLEETIRVLKEQQTVPDRPPVTLQADPQPLEESPPNKSPMKKPSQFGQE